MSGFIEGAGKGEERAFGVPWTALVALEKGGLGGEAPDPGWRASAARGQLIRSGCRMTKDTNGRRRGGPCATA